MKIDNIAQRSSLSNLVQSISFFSDQPIQRYLLWIFWFGKIRQCAKLSIQNVEDCRF